MTSSRSVRHNHSYGFASPYQPFDSTWMLLPRPLALRGVVSWFVSDAALLLSARRQRFSMASQVSAPCRVQPSTGSGSYGGQHQQCLQVQGPLGALQASTGSGFRVHWVRRRMLGGFYDTWVTSSLCDMLFGGLLASHTCMRCSSLGLTTAMLSARAVQCDDQFLRCALNVDGGCSYVRWPT